MRTAATIFAAGLLVSGIAAAAPVATPNIGTAPALNTALNARAVSSAALKPTLLLRGLDKITGRAFDIVAPLNTPVKFATLMVTARYCYSTPASETPETAAFVQIEDNRPDKPKREVFSGWMYASSPGLNGMQHPLYDVWVIFCRTNAPATAPKVASRAPVKVKSPDSTDNEGLAPLPEGADQ
jgi:hypothetical protein